MYICICISLHTICRKYRHHTGRRYRSIWNRTHNLTPLSPTTAIKRDEGGGVPLGLPPAGLQLTNVCQRLAISDLNAPRNTIARHCEQRIDDGSRVTYTCVCIYICTYIYI